MCGPRALFSMLWGPALRDRLRTPATGRTSRSHFLLGGSGFWQYPEIPSHPTLSAGLAVEMGSI